MGRDDHFLSRLYRFDQEHAALAVELYRRPVIIQRAILLARPTIVAGRVVLALDDTELGPRIIATDDGHFVTCLGQGMANGPWSIIERSVLDIAREEHWIGELDEVARSSASHREWATTLTELEHAGRGLSRETFDRLVRFAGTEPVAMAAVMQRQADRWLAGVEYLARRPEDYVVPTKVSIELWSAAWATVHLSAVVQFAGEWRTRWEFGEAITATVGDELGKFRARKERESTRESELAIVVGWARRNGQDLRQRRLTRAEGNERCPCGSGRRRRKCCDRVAAGSDSEDDGGVAMVG
ncbi:MAG: SEC-C domain-containing protein [Myxococcales bacterium]|nr:SEC-C domain-containing protein [Myxococcales bacterium]